MDQIIISAHSTGLKNQSIDITSYTKLTFKGILFLLSCLIYQALYDPMNGAATKQLQLESTLSIKTEGPIQL